MNDRIQTMIKLYQKLNPDIKVDKDTKINNATISNICKYEGEVYYRVKRWCEEKVSKLKEVKFSGIKDEYIGGATRDSREGKGRFDLISPHFLKRIAKVLEKGAINHGDHNWKGGIKYSRLIDSSLRHITQYNSGMRDEDHIVQAVCNLMFLIHFEEEGRDQELNDLHKSKTL